MRLCCSINLTLGLTLIESSTLTVAELRMTQCRMDLADAFGDVIFLAHSCLVILAYPVIATLFFKCTVQIYI